MRFAVSDKHPHCLRLEVWEMTEFYVKHRLPTPPGKPIRAAHWELRADVVEWLRNFNGLLNLDEVFPSIVYVWDLYCGSHLRFRTQQDLVMFKLAWGGQ